LKANGTHQFLVYSDDVNRLDESLHTIKINTEDVTSKKTGLEANTAKTKYLVMSRDQNSGQNNIKINDKTFERVYGDHATSTFAMP
jgi:hypothetical protein